MSLMGLFDLGRSGLFANQKALRVASNNVANVNTSGYSRQDVLMEAASPVEIRGNYVGRGVGNIEIRRHFDNFIFYQILGQSLRYGESYSTERSLSYIEQIFNEIQGFGLSASMKSYFNAWLRHHCSRKGKHCWRKRESREARKLKDKNSQCIDFQGILVN